MRNLKEFPITKDEIIDCLRQLQEDIIKEDLVGDMRPILLEEAMDIIKPWNELIS